MANDIKTAGSANIFAGEYNNISTAGSCRINGDIVCNKLKTAGSCHSEGAVKCSGSIETAGSCHFEGTVECAGKIETAGSFHADKTVAAGAIKTAGSSKFGGDVKAGAFESSGSCSIDGNLHAENITCAGSATIEGDCEGETILFYSPQIDGLLNGGTVVVRLSGRNSEIGSIGCEKLTIEYSNDISVMEIFKIGSRSNRKYSLSVDSIEADEVNIVGTKAEKISCVNAVIGEGCEIELLEYSGNAEISPSATVNRQVRI